MVEDQLFLTPRVLTDDMYVLYGQHTGSSLPSQRQAAYAIAERLMEEELETPLMPTTLTGTYGLPFNGRLQLRKARVQSIGSVSIIHANPCGCTLASCNACGYLYNDKLGILDVSSLCNSCSCGCGRGYPYQVQVVYTAGLDAVMSSHPILLLALSIVAELSLQQITDPGAAEGGAGDPGVQRYSLGRYSEERTKLRRSRFGSSARANYAANLVVTYKRIIGLAL